MYPPGMIGLACGETGRFTDFYTNLMALDRPAGTKFKKQTGLGPANPFNDIGVSFLADPTLEWLFLINDDNLHPPDTLMRLLRHMFLNRYTDSISVIGGLYLGRIMPFEPIIMERVPGYLPNSQGYRKRILQHGQSGLMECAALGDGCLLIHRRVMERVGRPWWEYGETVGDACDHDMVFCRKVRAAGYHVWVDLNLWIDHIALVAVRPHRAADGEWQVHLVQGADGRHIVLPAAHREGD